ncbi:MAG: TetR/AcrR family transcriptional regulator [Nocardioides sp.]
MKTARKYTMGARAEAVEETRQRILGSLITLAGERPFAEITLDLVAERAGTTVQTVLRRFGSKDAVLAEAMELAMAATQDERRTPSGDVPTAVRVVVDHYEVRGRTALLMLAQEDHDDVARMVTDRGKAMHRSWVRDAFAPATEDDTVLDLLVVATDVYAWKLLRLDRGHSRAVTERLMHTLVEAVLAPAATTAPEET